MHLNVTSGSTTSRGFVNGEYTDSVCIKFTMLLVSLQWSVHISDPEHEFNKNGYCI